jgi:SAM-dependent methyltransferase
MTPDSASPICPCSHRNPSFAKNDRWRRCKRCGSLYRSPQSPESIAELYNAASIAETNVDYAFGGTTARIAEALLSCAGWLPSDGPVLEIGAGRGVMANLMARRGASVSVVEPYSSADFTSMGITRWRNHSDIPHHTQFSWIFLIEVIEHVEHPLEFLASVRLLLGTNGRIFLTTPNAMGLHARMRGLSWREACNPTHLQLYSRAALLGLASKAGLKSLPLAKETLPYKQSRTGNMLLGITQRLGLDGGLRILLTPTKVET